MNSNAPLRILVAEDHPTNRRLLEELLARMGHLAHATCNGKEAVQAYKRDLYDVVLMDCQMPEMDGYTAARLIREDEALRFSGRRAARIIAVTAHALNGEREKCLSIGMDDFLTKPLTGNVLQRALQGVVAGNHVDGHSTSGLEISVDRLISELDRDTVADLINTFITETGRQLPMMREAMTRQDLKAVSRCAHSLAGSASVFDCEDLVLVSRALEDAAESQPRFKTLAMIEGVARALERTLSELRGVLRSLEAH